MCLAVPARIHELDEHVSTASVDILGVRRRVNVELLQDEPLAAGDWVLVHVGFAMSRISEQRAEEQLELLSRLGEAAAAREEIAGSSDADVPSAGADGAGRAVRG